MSREATADTVTTTSNDLHLVLRQETSEPILIVSKTPVLGSITITRNDYRVFRLYMLHIFRVLNSGSSVGLQFGKPVRIDDTLKAVLYFLYADIARRVAPGLSEHDQLERTALALYYSNVAIPPTYYAIQRPIKEKSGALTRVFDPTAWNTPGRHFFDASVSYKINSFLYPLSTACLNAVENLDVIENIITKTDPEQRSILLSTPITVNIEHLNIQRTGTPLQLALYGDDEDIVAYLKTVMDSEEFERQSKDVFRNALPLELRTELDDRSASALEYKNAMLEVQKAEAERLCNEAFLFDAANNRYTITNATVTDFQQKLENYVRHNPMHNPAILHRLYEIYKKLPGVYAEDCLFSQKAIGHAQALSSARWLQHYAQSIYYLGGGDDRNTLEPPRRSFICRDSNSPVDIRSFIPSRLGVDSFVSIFGRVTRDGGAVVLAEGRWWLVGGRGVPKFMSSKNSKLSELVTRRWRVCARKSEGRSP